MDALELAREAYITSDLSYRALGEKFGISKSSLQQQGAREDWAGQRSRYRQALALPEEDPEQMLRHAARLLLQKIELAVTQLDLRQSVTVRKEKQILYENPDRRDKPTGETVTESEEVKTVSCPVDRQGIQILAKALRDVQALLTEEDVDREKTSITVRLEGGAEEYAL